jgi:hypothetical protein
MSTKKYGSLQLVAGDLILTNAAGTATLTISAPISGTNSLNLASGIQNDSLVAGTSVKAALETLSSSISAVSGTAITSLTGEVVASGPGAASATIASGSITNVKVSNTAAIAYSKLNLSASITNADIAATAAISRSKLELLTASRALVSNGVGEIAAAPVTSTELGYLSGTTSSVQTQLDAKIPSSEKGSALGVATLDAGGKVPVSQLPSSIMEYKGTWNAATNTPTLANGTGDSGDVYVVSSSGTVNFGAGPITFTAGDWVMYNGSQWEKSVNSNAVASVNGYTGVVVLDKTDIGLDQVDNTSDADKNAATATLQNKTISFSDGNVLTGYSLNDITAGVDPLSLLNGGTGVSANSPDEALNALLPDQTASAGKFLQTDGSSTSWATVSQPLASYATTWVPGDGATKVVTHNLGTMLCQVSVLDENWNQVWIDTTHMDSLSQLTLTASIAPTGTWRVVVVGHLGGIS